MEVKKPLTDEDINEALARKESNDNNKIMGIPKYLFIIIFLAAVVLVAGGTAIAINMPK